MFLANTSTVYCNRRRELWSDNKHMKQLLLDSVWKVFENSSDRCHAPHRNGADWVSANVQSLAFSCPPLIDYKGGMAIGSLIHELTASCASRVSSSLLSVPHSQSIDWIRDCTGVLDVYVDLSSIKAQHGQERRAMALGMALFVSGDI